MKEQDEYKYKKVKPNLDIGFVLQNSPFAKFYLKLIPFMGFNNAHFLTAITDHYKYLRTRKKKHSKKPLVRDGECWFSYRQFEEKYGISRHHSKKALREIHWLVKKIDSTAKMAWPIVKINEFACFVFSVIISAPAMSREESQNLFKMITEDEELQREIRRRLKKMEKSWKGKDAKRLGRYGEAELSKRAKKDCNDFYHWITDKL